MAYLKPVTEITDRAKRLRANKIHKLKKRCEECQSKRNLGVGHKDGDESNNRPSNLFTQCKSCNGKQTARDIKAGRGVRTRQYNPGAINLAQYVQAAMDHVRGSHDAAGKVLHETPKAVRRAFAKEIWFRRGYRGNPPADIMPEFLAGKLKDSHGRVVRDKAQARAILLSELRALGKIPARKNASGLAVNQYYAVAKDNRVISQFYQKITNARKAAKQLGGAIIKLQPGDVGAGGVLYGGTYVTPRGYAANPELPEVEKAAHAVVHYEHPSQHVGKYCNGCTHFIPSIYVRRSRCEGVKSPIMSGDWCKNFVHIGNRSTFAPARRNPDEGAADSLYRKFHGRGPDRIYEMQVAGVDPYGGHPELTSLGPLVRLIVGENVVLGGQYGDEVKEADWVCELPFVPSVARWHQWLEERERSIAEAKARLREWKTPDLAAVPNTKQLYILGKQNLTAEQLNAVGADPEKDLLDLGSVYLVEYFTQKRFDRFEPINYFHHFSEVSKSGWPRLIYDRVHGLLSLAGGAYRVTPRGIEN